MEACITARDYVTAIQLWVAVFYSETVQLSREQFAQQNLSKLQRNVNDTPSIDTSSSLENGMKKSHACDNSKRQSTYTESDINGCGSMVIDDVKRKQNCHSNQVEYSSNSDSFDGNKYWNGDGLHNTIVPLDLQPDGSAFSGCIVALAHHPKQPEGIYAAITLLDEAERKADNIVGVRSLSVQKNLNYNIPTRSKAILTKPPQESKGQRRRIWQQNLPTFTAYREVCC